MSPYLILVIGEHAGPPGSHLGVSEVRIARIPFSGENSTFQLSEEYATLIQTDSWKNDYTPGQHQPS